MIKIISYSIILKLIFTLSSESYSPTNLPFKPSKFYEKDPTLGIIFSQEKYLKI